MANKAGLYNKRKNKKRKRVYALPSGGRVKCTKEQYAELAWRDKVERSKVQCQTTK